MSIIRLEGCTSEPLSSYLTGLAVLRLVSEQKDPDTRGWWKNSIFYIKSALDRDELLNFFQNEYVPTPIVSPWSGGSGFYEGDNIEGLKAILESDEERFAQYQRVIRTVHSLPEMPDVTFPIEELLGQLQERAEKSKGKKKEDYLNQINETRTLAGLIPLFSPDENILSLTIKDLENQTTLPKNASQCQNERAHTIKALIASAKKIRNQIKSIERGSGKEQIISACRDRLDDCAVEWIDAAVVIDPDGEPQYPPILGTGGNEGRLEYSNGFMKNLKWMLIDYPEVSGSLLKSTLFGEPTDKLQYASVGQYDPGRAGGFNQGCGIETKKFPVNPWTYIFTMEGTIPWASSVSRSQKSIGGGFLRSPFTVRSTPVGYGSSSVQEEARAEIWVPLWKRPASYREIRSLLSEGRADLGRTPASNGIEFAEAATSLGIDRGISEFVRYSLLKRRGDNYVALPAGRFPVGFRTESDLLRELNPLLRIIDRFKRDETPARFTSARRRIDEAIYDTLLHGGATHLKYLIAAIGQLEKLISHSGHHGNPIVGRPLSGLHPKWIVAADDGSIEMRIAVALASIRGTGGVGPIRSNLEPVDPQKPWSWGSGRGQISWEGNSFTTCLSSVLARRMMDANRLGTEKNPLYGAIQLCYEDISALIEGNLDESLIEDLLFGLTWIRWEEKTEVSAVRRELMHHHGWGRPVVHTIVPRSFALLKLLFLPGGIRREGEPIIIKPEASIIPLLCAGRIMDACTIAGRRLRSTGLIPITTSFPNGNNGIRITAALLLPIQDEKEMMKLVLKPQDK